MLSAPSTTKKAVVRGEDLQLTVIGSGKAAGMGSYLETAQRVLMSPPASPLRRESAEPFLGSVDVLCPLASPATEATPPYISHRKSPQRTLEKGSGHRFREDGRLYCGLPLGTRPEHLGGYPAAVLAGSEKVNQTK